MISCPRKGCKLRPSYHFGSWICPEHGDITPSAEKARAKKKATRKRSRKEPQHEVHTE